MKEIGEAGPTRITAVVSEQKTRLTEVFNKYLYPLIKKNAMKY